MNLNEIKKETKDLYTGFFKGEVVAVNPTRKELEELFEQKWEDVPEMNYVSVSSKGFTKVKFIFWIRDVESKKLFKVSYSITKELAQSFNKNIKMFINNAGLTSWKEDDTYLSESFTSREYRRGYTGESDLYEFIRTWCHKMDYSSSNINILLNWDLLEKGDFSEIKESIGSEITGEMIFLATVKETPLKFYQGVFKKGILPSFMEKFLYYKNYNDLEIRRRIKNSRIQDLKGVEKAIFRIVESHGCKDFFTLDKIKPFVYEEKSLSRKDTL